MMVNNFGEICKAAFAQPLVTDRLSIRLPAPTDAQSVSAFFNAENMAFARELGWPADDVGYTPRYISDIVLPYLEEINKNNDCWFFIFKQKSNDIIGKFSFWRDEQDRDQMHYFILPSQRQQGYATEATKSCLRHAAEKGIIRTLHAEVTPENAASQALLRRMNFTEKGPVHSQISRYAGQTLIAFEKNITAPAPRLQSPSPQ